MSLSINYFDGVLTLPKYFGCHTVQPLTRGFAARITSIHKKDVLMLLVGERGSGKSYSLLSLAEGCSHEVAKKIGGRPEDYFKPEKNVAVIQDKAIEESMRNLERYNIYILDDAGVGWDSRAFATTLNKRLNHILQTCRTDNCILLISVIDPFTIDKVPRTMVRYYSEMSEQLHDYGMNLIKVFRNKRLFREGKNVTPHLRFGPKMVVKRWIVNAPSKELAERYDKIREINARKVREQMCEIEETPIAPAPQQRTCPHCNYEWFPKGPKPKKCPRCMRFLIPPPKDSKIKTLAMKSKPELNTNYFEDIVADELKGE